MDPASIISLTAGLVTLCARVGKGLHDVHTTWSGASMTISAISSETAVIAAALQQIENVARNDPQGLSSRLDAGSGQLATSFELSLGGCELTLNILNEQLSKLTASSKSVKFLSFRSKARYVWNEAEMRDLLQNVRGQQSALNLLLNAVQSESISDVRRILNDNNIILSKMVKQSQALKSVRAASTIDGKDMVFDFDEQIISSNAYRRAFNSFVNAPPQQNTEPDNTHDKDVSIVDSGISSMTVGGDDSGTSNLATRQIKKDQSQKVKRKSIPKSFEPPVPMSELPANIKNLTMLLHKAVEKGHATLVENLIRKGARLDVGDANGNLTTHIAATGGKSDVLDVLLQKGVIDIEATNFEDNRALNLACVHGHLAAVRVLLRFGADVSGKGMLGWSPLHHAAGNDKLEVMQFLLDNGAALDATATEGDTPLISAIAYDCYLAAERLIKLGSQIEAANFSLNRPLSVACKLDRIKIVQMLVENGADIHGKGCDGWSPLHFAASINSTVIVQYLIEKGASLEFLNNAGFTPLHSAAQFGCEATVHCLINAGSDVESSHNGGDRPLDIAATNGYRNIITILISNGADVNGKGSQGWCPIHEAAGNGHVEAVKLLVAQGANVNALATSGKTAMHIGANFGDVVKTLIDLGANAEVVDDHTDRVIHHAADSGHLLTMQALIAHNASLNATNGLHFTPITLAAARGHISILGALLDAGVDINYQGANNGWTALHYTAGNNKPKALSFLLSRGANLEAEAHNGDNALHVSSSSGHVECMRILLEAGINKDIIQRDGKTAMDYAVDQGEEAAMELLLT